MPRNGSGVYSPPAGTTAVVNTIIAPDAYNNYVADMTADANNARPVNAGGTGATNAASARANLGAASTNDLEEALYTTVASAATIDLGSYLFRKFIITGTSDISSLGDTGTADNVPIALFFKSALNIIPSASLLTPGHVTGTGTLTTSSTSMTGVTNPKQIAVGWYVWGTGIPAGTTVAAISGNTVTLSASATSGGSVSFTAAPPLAVKANDQWFAICSGLAGVWSIVSAIGEMGYGTSGPGNLLQLDTSGNLPPVSGQNLALLPSTIFPVGASVSGNALTVTLNPCTLEFRSTTLTSGAPVRVPVTDQISLVVPASATLGTTGALFARLALIAINYSGAAELAIVNLAGAVNLDETSLISTTTISTSATSSSTIYSATGRANVAFRLLGWVEITEAVAGTWATGPTKVQGGGGLALTGLALVQTWSAPGYSIGTVYYNTSPKPIDLKIEVNPASATAVGASINGASVGAVVGGANSSGTQTYVGYLRIPPMSSFQLTGGSGAGAYAIWIMR